MACDTPIAGCGCGILRPVVLAASSMAWVQGGYGRHSTLAVAGGSPLGVRLRYRASLRLGFRMDGARHACASRSAEAAGRRGLLPLRAQPDVLAIRDYSRSSDWNGPDR